MILSFNVPCAMKFINLKPNPRSHPCISSHPIPRITTSPLSHPLLPYLIVMAFSVSDLDGIILIAVVQLALLALQSAVGTQVQVLPRLDGVLLDPARLAVGGLPAQRLVHGGGGRGVDLGFLGADEAFSVGVGQLEEDGEDVGCAGGVAVQEDED